MEPEKIRALIAQMTLEEKASLCSGADSWHTKAVERLGIPSSMMTDGPHGLRKQNPDQHHVNDSIPSVCFPAGCAEAASFNRTLLYELGVALGNECQAEDVGVILGPALNIKRSPLGGRNFEYYSEDPCLAGQMAAAQIRGIQSRGVGACPKHFLANNQEHRRMSTSAQIDERTLREIYLAGFEGAVKGGRPWTLMCSYNRINGTYAAGNRRYLTEILRDEWGFDGYVMSDWGAVDDRVPDLKAGLDLEMPASGGANDRRIVEAVKNGTLDEKVLDTAVERMLTVLYRTKEQRRPATVFDRVADHELARRIAGETTVLLKNEILDPAEGTPILPLQPGQKIAVIGKYAAQPRYQGGGSSHINSAHVTDALSVLRDWGDIVYAQGFDDTRDEADPTLMAEAVSAARDADIAVLFVGLPDSFESEGYDRRHMRLPDCQNALIDAVCGAQENVVVVLHNGAPVEMPWIDRVKGLLEAYLGGDAIGGAIADILTGKVNPSGHLPETIPLQLEDNPSYLYYGGEGDVCEYREGVFVGYRYYDKKKMAVQFPFGHGLSYTNFVYENLTLDRDSITDRDRLTVTVDVANVGDRPGAAVLQLYVKAPKGQVIRPVRELRDFEKVFLLPGESRTVVFYLDRRAFAYWNTAIHDWHVESGSYQVEIGSSSREIEASVPVELRSTVRIPRHYDMNSTMGDLLSDPLIREDVLSFARDMGKAYNVEAESTIAGEDPADMYAAMVGYSPLRTVAAFGAGNYEALEDLLRRINEKAQAQ